MSAGTIAGIAASAISTGADVYRMGKLDAADEARFDDWIGDFHLSAADLHVKVDKESYDGAKGVWRCVLVDDRNSKASISVERRTETLCRTRIDVGWFGSEPTARLILARVRQHEHAASQNPPTTRPDPERQSPL